MNNSVAALCRALSASLQNDVLPKVDDEFACGQLSAAIYVLNNLERQAAWSPTVLLKQIALSEAAIETTREAVSTLGLTLPSSDPQIHEIELEARRDAANAQLCVLFKWFSEQGHSNALTAELCAIENHLVDLVAQTVLEEKRLISPSMMREMSGG